MDNEMTRFGRLSYHCKRHRPRTRFLLAHQFLDLLLRFSSHVKHVGVVGDPDGLHSTRVRLRPKALLAHALPVAPW